MWTPKQKKDFAKAAKQTWGKAWDLLSDRQKEAEISMEIVKVLMTQMDSGPPMYASQIKDLIRGTMRAAGLWGEDE